MFLRVDFSQALFRTLYDKLYDRITKFAIECGDTEAIAKSRLLALQTSPMPVNLLIELDDTGVIVAHCLINFQQLSDQEYIAFVEQIKVDSGHNKEFVLQCIEYVKSYDAVVAIHMLTDERKARAFKKSYKFEVKKVLMVLPIERS